ncbi:ubiquitin-like-specific protease ESD4 isoform X1 [Nicotiana tabacum]|uniref:Ubiquitin-like-specific protease ESD4 isoform X1 n=1 Tax=Nicotiana tabacum TaxID=4097 RepID=A0AC58SR74_TOBAC|nr:ubiquitin-like-specific protease ESD4 isoform X2 [Nicotiana tomentosiformis]
MGALTFNRKRGNDFFSSNYKTQFSNPSNFDHISKKPKLSIYQTLNPPKSTVQRFLKYPDPINPIRRQVHAPCRKSRFGSKCISANSAPEMGNFVSRVYDEAKKSAFYSLRCLKKVKEVIFIDDDDAKKGDLEAGVYEKSGFYGNLEAGVCEKNNFFGNLEGGVGEKSVILSQEGKETNGAVEILDGVDGKDSSVVTAGLDDGNLKEESVGKMLDTLALNPTSDSAFYVPLYKKLLGSVGKMNDKLKRLQFQIGYNEKCLETYSLLRPQKKGEHVKQDVISEPFVPLTEEDEAEVLRALSKSNRRVLVTHQNSNIDITGEILQCLRPREWLNDEVINVYLELLKEREKREPQKFLKCHFFNTFFYKKLISGRGGYNYQSVRRWTSQRKLGYCLLECDKIFVPIHKEIHWCLAVINKKDEKFQYLDSLRGRDTQVLKVLARYFVDEVKDKSGKDIDVSSWKQEFVEDLPEQKNGFDCGVFMIKNADFYSRDIGLCFNQEDMPYFRLRTAKEILRLKAD